MNTRQGNTMTLHRSAHGAWLKTDVDLVLNLLTVGDSQYGIVFLAPRGAITGWTEGAHVVTGFTGAERVI